ncbi:MAG: 2-octaprenyl-6-methoxyphenyl hydroxylase [Rhodospirillales bacterium]|nr:MAG: 2-octaprenyl-6-methoxyphenyl hydroxylase [Rhodospirillales bacterium]
MDVDVVVIGGALVGGTLAAALGQAGMIVAVVDAADPRVVADASFDGRASAIALSSRRLLEGVGVWDLLGNTAAPMLDIRVADAGSHLFLHYRHEEVGDEPFGHMVENTRMRQALIQRMDALPSVTLVAPQRCLRLDRSREGVRAHLADGSVVRAPLAVAADGRSSPTRDGAGIDILTWRYDQIAIVCTVAHERPHNFVACEHFLPAGPFAILPLLGNRSSIVWTERAELAPTIMGLDDAGFSRELRQRFGDFLGKVEPVGPRWSYPLSWHLAETAVAERLALVGDAYHGMHPIAGQGLNMGLRDVAALAEVVTDSFRLGLDWGAPSVLDRYQRWRRFDNMLMLGLTDGLNRLFSNDIAPIKLARDLGLATVNRIPPLKRLFMRHAMGVVGELPRLMQGRPL